MTEGTKSDAPLTKSEYKERTAQRIEQLLADRKKADQKVAELEKRNELLIGSNAELSEQLELAMAANRELQLELQPRLARERLQAESLNAFIEYKKRQGIAAH